MTIRELEKTNETKQGSMLFKVSKHKTGDTHSPASVVLSSTLFSYHKVYVSKRRRQVSNSDSERNDDKSTPVFLFWG